jgi:hypothetical protein
VHAATHPVLAHCPLGGKMKAAVDNGIWYNQLIGNIRVVWEGGHYINSSEKWNFYYIYLIFDIFKI